MNRTEHNSENTEDYIRVYKKQNMYIEKQKLSSNFEIRISMPCNFNFTNCQQILIFRFERWSWIYTIIKHFILIFAILGIS